VEGKKNSTGMNVIKYSICMPKNNSTEAHQNCKTIILMYIIKRRLGKGR
jgi:hypothetical protein